MEVFGPDVASEFVIFEQGGEAAGICLLVYRTVLHGPVPIRKVYVNTAGEPEGGVCIEFNHVLCRTGYERAVISRLAEYLKAQPWDELVLSGFCQGEMLTQLVGSFSGLPVDTNWRSSYYVDLAALRAEGREHEAALPHKWRQHVRQSKRYYDTYGELAVQPARDVDEALAMLDQLAELHQRTWTGRGEPGSFRAAPFVAFHRALIRRTFPQGGTELFRVSAGSECVGLRYVFIANGRVYCYQAGLNYHNEHHHCRPGLTAHTCAIRHYQRRGLDQYDFLAGDTEHKRALGTHSRQLAWIVIRRGGKMRAWLTLRGIKRAVVSLVRGIGGHGPAAGGHCGTRGEAGGETEKA